MNPRMTSGDMRSPFKALPNIGPRPGFDPSQARFVIAEIVTVYTDPNGTPNFIFDVRGISDGATTGGDDNDITQAAMLQAGFGNISDTGRSPAGIVYVPEVGSRVLCVFIGSRWFIHGFLTGPSKGELTRILDPKDQRLVTYNPGIEYGLNRLIAPAKYDIPWLYGMTPGDVILGKDYSRLKLSDRGAFMSGGGTASLILLKTDGERLDRYSSYEARGIGHWFRHNFTRGEENADSQNQIDGSLANPPQGAMAYQCDIVETSPYIPANFPYFVVEKGHISRGFKNFGRSAIYATATSQTIAEEKKANNYSVMRVFIATPITKQPSPSEKTVSERVTSQKANELEKAAFEPFDMQLDVDGSFRMRAGNTSKAPKGQDVQPTKELDYSFEYVAKKLAFLLRLGKAGANVTSLIMDLTQILVHSPTWIAKIDNLIDFTAKKSITQTTKDYVINAKSIKINQGPVEIEKKLDVKDDIKTEKSVEAQKDVKADNKVIADKKVVSPAYSRRGGESPAGQTYQVSPSVNGCST